MLQSNIKQRISFYLDNEQDERFRSDLLAVMERDDTAELEDRFYTDLEFGTAGMRGVIGGGLNRMNPFVVQLVTQGIANYLADIGEESGSSVVIAYDSRNYSEDFARAAAEVFCGNGVQVMLYDSLRPVPLLSYAVRRLNATAGIVITASHNPPQYNGYKVYWESGGQIIAPHDARIIEEVGKLQQEPVIRRLALDEAQARGTFRWLGSEDDEPYYEAVLSRLFHQSLFQDSELQERCRVLYTPIHGSGNLPVRKICERLHFPVTVLAEQEEPDGNFPTVVMPNPEEPDAMKMALEKGREIGAALVLGTDPDADRLGIAIADADDRKPYLLLTGNQIAVLLGDYIMQQRKAEREERQLFCVKSLVTTDLLRRLAEDNGVACRDTLTGFKYIAEQMDIGNERGELFVFGAEESFGYLIHDQVRDKDAVSAAVVAIEMLLWYTNNGKSLSERLEEIRNTYGRYDEAVLSQSFQGAAGRERIEKIMQRFRHETPSSIGGLGISEVIDLKSDRSMGLPAADVVICRFSEGSKLIVRPSGTEPKIKFYIHVTSPPESDNMEASNRNKIAVITQELKSYLA